MTILTPSRAESRARADAIRTDADTTSQIKLREHQEKTRTRKAREKEKARRARLKAREKAKRKRQKARQERKAARRQALRGAVARIRSDVVQAYATVVYAVAVSSAVYGQVSAVTGADQPWYLGAAMAIFIEGVGLVMALTADQLRKAGERALLPQALTWVFTALAAGINLAAHADTPIVGIGLAAASVTGITVWEIRSRAAARRELRAAGKLPEPMVRFGPRRWVWHLPSTWRAHRLDVAERVSPEAAVLLARVARRRAERGARCARNGAERRVARAARMALRRLSRAGAGGPALAALERYAVVVRNGAERCPALVSAGPVSGPPAVDAGAGTGVPERSGVSRALTDEEIEAEARALFERLNPARLEYPVDPWERAAPETRDSVPGTAEGGVPLDGLDPLALAAFAVRDELVRQGRPVSQRALAAGLRARGHKVATERVAALHRLVLPDAG